MNKVLIWFCIVVGVNLTHAQLFPVRVEQQWGLINKKGVLVVDANYEHIGWLEKKAYYLVQKNGKLGALDKAGKLQLPCVYKNLFYLGEELFAAQKTVNWQVINAKGKVVFDSLDASVRVLKNGFFSYEHHGKLGLAHCNTGQLSKPVYKELHWAQGNWIELVDTNGGKQWMNQEGRLLLPSKMQNIEWDENGWVWGQKNNRWRLYDTLGQPILSNEWTQKQYCGLGLYRLQKNKEQYLYAPAIGNLVQCDFTTFKYWSSEYLKLQFSDGTMALVDSTAQLLFRVHSKKVTKLGYGLFKYSQGGSFGLINTKKDSIHPAKYQFVGNFSEQVAMVCADAKCGVINQEGKEVLPLAYERNFSVQNNQARYRPKGKSMCLFSFDEKGELVGKQDFSRARSLRIGASGRQTSPTASNTRVRDVYQINDTLRWTYHAGVALWGLMNTKTEQYKYAPKWSDIHILPNQGLTIVFESRSGIGGKQNIGRINLVYNQRAGLFNNEHGVPISAMEFLDIRISDFTQDSLPVARCIFIGGKHGLINSRGRVIVKNYTYIGAFVKGKARATQQGKLEVNLTGTVEPYLYNARSYYKKMMTGFSYDQDDDLRYYQQFNSLGRLHCVNPKWGYIGLDGKPVIDFQYAHVQKYHRGHAVVTKNGKQGIVDEEGMEKLPLQYNSVKLMENTDKNLYLIHRVQPLKGAVDTLGQLIVPTQYIQIGQFKEGRIAVKDTSGAWGFLDEKGQIIVPIKQRLVRDYQGGRAAFKYKNQWGFYDKKGQVAIPASYSRVGDFSEGKAWVYLAKQQKGYINQEGKLLFKGAYSQVRDFHNGLAVIRISRAGWGIVDSLGNFVLSPKKKYKKITDFNAHGLAIVKIGKRYRLINQKGRWLNRRSFARIKDFSEGLAIVRLKNINSNAIVRSKSYWRLMDTTGTLLGRKKGYKHIEPFSEGRALFKNSLGRYGYLNQQGAIAIPATYIKASNFESGRAVVWATHNKTGVIDTTGKFVMPAIYNKILNYTHDLALFKKSNSAYCFMHENAQLQTPLLYRAVKPFQNRAAWVKSNDKWGLINTQGFVTLSEKYDAITTFQEGAANVTINKLWGITDAQGQVLLAPIYEKIEFVGFGLFRVEKHNQVGYINTQGEWLWPLQ